MALRAQHIGWLIGAGVVCALLPVDAWAQTTAGNQLSFGSMLCSVLGNMGQFPLFFTWIAYIAATILSARTVMLFKAYSESPGKPPMATPLLHGAAAGSLFAAPTMASNVINTLYGSTNAGGAKVGCVPAAASSGGGLALDQMLVSFVGDIKNPIYNTTLWVAYFLGLLMILKALYNLSQYGGQNRDATMKSIITNLGIGGILMASTQTIEMIMTTVFRSGTIAGSSALAITNQTGGDMTQFTTAVTAALSFIQVVGVIGFIRGWFVMKKAVEGGGNATMGQGLAHIIGGALAMNIYMFLQAAEKTFNIDLIG